MHIIKFKLPESNTIASLEIDDIGRATLVLPEGSKKASPKYAQFMRRFYGSQNGEQRTHRAVTGPMGARYLLRSKGVTEILDEEER